MPHAVCGGMSYLTLTSSDNILVRPTCHIPVVLVNDLDSILLFLSRIAPLSLGQGSSAMECQQQSPHPRAGLLIGGCSTRLHRSSMSKG